MFNSSCLYLILGKLLDFLRIVFLSFPTLRYIMIVVSNLATSGWPQVAVRRSAELTSVLRCTSDFYLYLKYCDYCFWNEL